MTPADQGAHVQSLNFPRKAPSLPVRDNQGCLLMPVTQSVQTLEFLQLLQWQREIGKKKKKKKKKTHTQKNNQPAKAQQHVDCCCCC